MWVNLFTRGIRVSLRGCRIVEFDSLKYNVYTKIYLTKNFKIGLTVKVSCGCLKLSFFHVINSNKQQTTNKKSLLLVEIKD